MNLATGLGAQVFLSLVKMHSRLDCKSGWPRDVGDSVDIVSL